MDEGGVKSMARRAVLGALFLVPFTPLVVVNTAFFPFITGKAIFFRVLAEIAFGGWVVLAFLDKSYRPRFSWVGAVVVAFVAWMGLADLFALNVTKAFWSNFERMEGWVLLVHLLGYFLAMSNVLRVEKKWRTWFLTSLGVSTLLVIYAFFQLGGVFEIHQGSSRIDATLGNSAYFAIYLLFSVCVALWLALTEDRPWLKWSLIGLAAIESVLIFLTETRGTIIGLVMAALLAAFLTAVTGSKRARTWATGALIGLVLLVGGFYFIRDSSFVQQNHVLQRVASISLADGQTRFTIWGMAFQGALERPIVGWGQEGFNYVFNKYYEPSLYGQESWFDRAHNAFIDWLSAGGFPAFLLYIALFGVAIAALWSHSELSRPERIALTAALVGYAFHNFFVFDNIYSYVYFFALLALIDSQVSRETRLVEYAEATNEDGVTYIAPVALVVTLGMIWWVNITALNTSTKLIQVLSLSGPEMSTRVTRFKELLASPGFAAQEIREQLVSFAMNAAQSQAVSAEDKKAIVELATSEMKKQVDAYPQDAREHLQLALIYRTAGDYARALEHVRIATELSPRKPEMWIELATTEWIAGNIEAARDGYKKAYELGGERPELAASAAAGDIAVGNFSSANSLLLRAYGTTTVDNNYLAFAYYQAKRWPELVRLWQLRASYDGAGVDKWFSLVSVKYLSGDRSGALRTLREMKPRFPDNVADIDAAIKEVTLAP